MKFFKQFLGLALLLGTVMAPRAWSGNTYVWTAGDTTRGGTGYWDTSTTNWVQTSTQNGDPASGTPTAWVNSAAGSAVESNFTAAASVTLGSDVSTYLLYFNGSGNISLNKDEGNLYKINLVGQNSGASSFGIFWLSSGFTAAATVNPDLLITDFAPDSSKYFGISSGSGSSKSAASLTINGNINFTGSNTGTKTLNFDAQGGQTYTYNGSTTLAPGGTATIAFSFGSTASNYNATYNMGGNNTGVSGNINVNHGIVIVNNSGALGNGTGTLYLGATNTVAANEATLLFGTSGLTVSNNIQITASSAATNNLGGQHTSGVSTYTGTVGITSGSLNLTQAAGGVTDISGRIYATSGTASITKLGSGIVRLTYNSGAQGWLGATAVNAGTLIVNNTTNGLGSGAVTVGTGTSTLAYLGGMNGAKIGSSVTLYGGGALAPGDINTTTLTSTTGTINLLNGLTWNSDNSNAGMYMQLGTSSDQVAITGSFTQGTGSTYLFNIANAGGLTVGQTYTLVSFDSTNYGSSSAFALDSVTQSLGINGTFSLTGTKLDFTVTAIPEPSTLALVVFGLASLLGLRVSKRRHS